MKGSKQFDVIIIGGSYSGLAAAMTLGRALRHVLVIDSGSPCNKQTPYSHNFITQDGSTPAGISSLARQQVTKYETVEFIYDLAIKCIATTTGFETTIASGEKFSSRKLIFATGIKDVMLPIDGFASCWGRSVIHCPYCHGYEFRHEQTGILGNGEYAFEFASLLLNWTKNLTIYTNGVSEFTDEQKVKIERHHVEIVEKQIQTLVHSNGHLEKILFRDGTISSIKALYARPSFTQHCTLPADLGCEITDAGYLKTDAMQKTTIPGIYACGDNTTRVRTVANAVAMGTTAGMMINKEIASEDF